MEVGALPKGIATDRRVIRSRAALCAAAVRLVSERGTTAVSVTELAEAANVGRQVLYLQFGDRDSLLVAAAVDLIERELTPRLAAEPDGATRSRMLLAARHMAEHRTFYRALSTGTCAFAVRQAMIESFESVHGDATAVLFGTIDRQTAADARTFFVAGMMAVIDQWLVGGGDAPDPESLADRLFRVAALVAGGRGSLDLNP